MKNWGAVHRETWLHLQSSLVTYGLCARIFYLVHGGFAVDRSAILLKSSPQGCRKTRSQETGSILQNLIANTVKYPRLIVSTIKANIPCHKMLGIYPPLLEEGILRHFIWNRCESLDAEHPKLFASGAHIA